VRFLSFYRDGNVVPGVVDGDRVRLIDTATVRDYIALAPNQRAARHGAETVPLEGLRLAAPVVPSRNVFCVGRNYLEHAKEGARALGRELKLPDVPTFFTKAPSAIAGPDAELLLQARVSSQYDFEAELAIVIGARCKDVREEDARDAIFGYTCANDVSARDLQRAHGQWFKGKSLDDTCPLGPWIVSADEAGDAQHLAIEMRINGVVKQSSNTDQMIFPIPRLIAELSKGMTLEPGDVIATGTPDGVGFARTPPEFLRDGDTMEVTIETIGTLHNLVRIS
jgi:2-keto-4-pentenoate hydratase/2-oxohepta-3-ene-1,7-dioic acid hydratase in catechol pathway